MSYCRSESDGKDQIIFMTKEDYDKPVSSNEPLITIPSKPEEEGAIKENGDINWSCPCLASTISGPCGYEFREAFSCFHYSNADPKGSDCFDKFMEMRDCFAKYPTVYPVGPDDDEDDEDDKNNDNRPSDPFDTSTDDAQYKTHGP